MAIPDENEFDVAGVQGPEAPAGLETGAPLDLFDPATDPLEGHLKHLCSVFRGAIEDLSLYADPEHPQLEQLKSALEYAERGDLKGLSEIASTNCRYAGSIRVLLRRFDLKEAA